MLCALAVTGAGAPGIVAASSDLADAQRLVDRAALNQQAIALAHSLADERDDTVAYLAGGREGQDTAGEDASSTTPGGESQRARVDRQVAEILGEDFAGAVPGPVRQQLTDLPKIRRQAIGGQSTAHDAYEAYTESIHTLQRVSRSVARGVPGSSDTPASGDGDTSAAPDAADTADALPYLGRAVEQASAVRGLVRGALAGTGSQQKLMTAAVAANHREQAAVADFEMTAGTEAQDTFDKTVNGTDVGIAERYLQHLTDHPYLEASDRAMSQERIVSTLSARIDRMRGVQSSLAAAEVERLEQVRDDEVTALELGIALVGGCLLLAVGISVQTARSMARPLSVLLRGSQRLAAEPVTAEPVRFTGRQDEFAEVVQALNELGRTAASFHDRATEAEADNGYLVGTKDELTTECERLQRECEALQARHGSDSAAVHGTFVHLALRTLGLIERQLGIIESLERDERDSERLAVLFRLDHLATRMRRYSENMLVMAGSEHAGGSQGNPVPLLDVARAAISEIEHYERVGLESLPPHTQVSGFAADDVSHLIAELLDNATTFSPPDAEVRMTGWMLETGEIMLSVQDEGIGMTSTRLAELNERLSEAEWTEPAAPEPVRGDDAAGGPGMGLYVVARLAARHGVRVQLREQKQGGIAAVAILPCALLPVRPSPGGAVRAAGSEGTPETVPNLPGSVAEANSHTLPTRPGRTRIAAPSAPSAPEEPAEPAPEEPAGSAPVAGTDAPPEPAERDAQDAHEWSGDEAGRDAPARTSGGATERVLTDKGLPKRTPKNLPAQSRPARSGKGGADAEELRRRLGGFQRGARDGLRDAAAEVAAERGANEEETRP